MTKPTLTKRRTGSSAAAPPSGGSADKPAAAATDPNSTIEIVFCFDTTGSMNHIIHTVKERVIELTERLLGDIPGIRIGILAHGDYGDEPYLLQQLDLTVNAVEICDFVRNVQGTGGGDSEECYELALHEVRTSFSWTPGTRKRLIMIGDDLPHELGSHRNQRNLDWKEEAKALKKELHLNIYSVQVNTSSRCTPFWKALAALTDGRHLQLENFSSIFDFIMAICYLEHGVEFFEAFEEEVRGRAEPRARDVDAMLSRLEAAPDAGLPSSSPDDDDDDDDDSAKPTADASLHRARHAPLKKKRATGAKTTAARVARASRKRLRRPATARNRREAEDLSKPEALKLCGDWSSWQVLATVQKPEVGVTCWRRFGLGWLRTKLELATSRANERVLVELGVRSDAQADKGEAVAVLYSRILPVGAHKQAVKGLLQGSNALKWHIHRAMSSGRRVEMRWTRVDIQTDVAPAASADAGAAAKLSSAAIGGKVRHQRHLLFKSNSYAWNSGRVVRAQVGGGLLSEPAPRARRLEHFLKSLEQESQMEVE